MSRVNVGWKSRNLVEIAHFYEKVHFSPEMLFFLKWCRILVEIALFHGIPPPESLKYCSNSVCFGAAGQKMLFLPELSEILRKILNFHDFSEIWWKWWFLLEFYMAPPDSIWPHLKRQLL